MGPLLIEPGVKYFLNNSLINCKQYKTVKNSLFINVYLLIFLIVLISVILYYKYEHRPTLEEKQKKEILKKTYILSKIKSINNKSHEDYKKLITSLPKFEE